MSGKNCVFVQHPKWRTYQRINVAFRDLYGRRSAVISRYCLTEANMGLSCCKVSASCPRCRESCGDDSLCECHKHEPCLDRCCNLCCQFCLDSCCAICSDDCSYTVCFLCTRMVLNTEQPTSTQRWEGRRSNKHQYSVSACVWHKVRLVKVKKGCTLRCFILKCMSFSVNMTQCTFNHWEVGEDEMKIERRRKIRHWQQRNGKTSLGKRSF